MSGGMFDYLYGKLDYSPEDLLKESTLESAESMLRLMIEYNFPDETIKSVKSFIESIKQIKEKIESIQKTPGLSKLLHDVEWHFSGDLRFDFDEYKLDSESN